MTQSIYRFVFMLMAGTLLLAACGSGGGGTDQGPGNIHVNATGTPNPWLEAGGPVSSDNAAQMHALGELIAPGTPSTIFDYAFSPDNRELVALNDQQLVAWNLFTGKQMFATARQDATNVYFSPNKTEIYTVDSTGGVNVYDADQGARQNSFKGHTQFSGVSAFDRLDGWLAVGGEDGTIKVWDPIKRESQVTFKAHPSQVSSLAFSPDGTLLASAGHEGIVYVWDWRQSKSVATFDHQGATIVRMTFSPDGKQLAVATDTYIAMWSMTDKKLQYALKTGAGGASDVLLYSPDGKYMISGGVAPDMNVWDPQTGAQAAVLPGVGKDRVSAVFSPDGKLLLASVLNGGVTLWNMTSINSTAKTINQVALDVGSKKILYVDWTSDGYLLTFFDATGPVYVWGIAKNDATSTP